LLSFQASNFEIVNSSFSSIKKRRNEMAEGNDTSSIGPLNATASKEGLSLIGYMLLVMVVTLVGYYLIGTISNLF
jgi:hypothetical protein